MFSLLRRIPTFVQSSREVVQRLETIKPPEYYQLIEADVDNLYPSINIDDGLQALHAFLTNLYTIPDDNITFIVKLTKWVLTNNYLEFGGLYYRQISGTAMGTPCAVVFACVYMHMIEQQALREFGRSCHSMIHIALFVRFIDDLLLIVSDYFVAKGMIDLLNKQRPWIHLTFKIRNEQANFLDLTIYKTRHHGIAVRAYHKPMNKFLFLPTTSCHPPHIFNGWIRGYSQRLRVNCSNDADYESNIAEFRQHLYARGYTADIVVPATTLQKSRKELLERTVTKPTTSIGVPFILTYTPAVRACRHELKEALKLSQIASLDRDFDAIFNRRSTTPLIAYKRDHNIREILAPSMLHSLETE